MENNIKTICLQEQSKNPIEIFNKIAKTDDIPMHGPIHHFLDGAAILTAFYNSKQTIDLEWALTQLQERSSKMPGGMCGMWGVCGAVSSIGAALSIIEGTGPLSKDGTWGTHMQFCAQALERIGQVNGPRCCKRDAYISFQTAIQFMNNHYQAQLESSPIVCSFSEKNAQCLKEQCPFYKKKKRKVAFICVHNSCRSQIAEALGNLLAKDVFESYSAGSEVKNQINQDAVRLMKKMYGIDMEKTQYSKLVSDIPEVDIAISMGCNVACPYIHKPFDDDWGLEDPTGKSDEAFVEIIQTIEKKILELKEYLK